MQLRTAKRDWRERGLGCALACFAGFSLLAGAGHPAWAAQQPSAKQISEYEAASEGERVRLLIFLAKNGQQELAATLLRTYPLQGKHAANRTLFIDGLILRAYGDLTGATEKFRAALASDPKLTMVRAELAQTLEQLDEDDSARHHLELLAADAPDEQAAAGVRAFIDRIDAKRPLTFSAYLSLAPTTNVNNGSNHSTVYTVNGMEWDIGSPSRKKSGIGAAAGINAGYSRRLGNDFMAVLAGSAEARIYDDEDFNTGSFSESGEIRYLLGKGHIGFGGVGSLSIDAKEFDASYVSYGPRLSFQYEVTPKNRLNASAVYEWRDYQDADYNDGTALLLDASWMHSVDSTTFLTLSAGYDKVDADLKSVSFDALSGGVGIYTELPHGITLDLGADARFAKFDDINALSGIVREDRRLTGSVAITKRDLNWFGYAPSVEYSYTWNSSNISLFDYDSHMVDFRLTKDF